MRSQRLEIQPKNRYPKSTSKPHSNRLQNHFQNRRKNGFQRGPNQINKQGTKKKIFMTQRMLSHPVKSSKTLGFLMIFMVFVILKCFKFRSQKSLKNHSKSFPNRPKIAPETGSKNTFKKHAKNWPQLPSKWLQNLSKSKPDEPKTIPRRPRASPSCPRPPPDPPQTSLWTDFGFDFNEFCTQHVLPETEKTQQSEVFSSSFRLR